jgi:hypothetical protein
MFRVSHSTAPRIPRALWLVIALYAVAHVLPVTKIFDSWMWGWQASLAPVELAAEALRHGQFDWRTVFTVFGWLPNPLLWLGVAWLIIGRQRDARQAGIGTGLAGLAAVACASLWLFDRGKDDDLSIGYYVWIASMVLLTGAGFWTAASIRR